MVVNDFKFEADNKYDLDGVFWPAGRNGWVFLNNVKSLSELYIIIEHEDIHDGLVEHDLYDEEEEAIIESMQWTRELDEPFLVE